VEQLEQQMSLVLSVIPQEIIDAYNVANAISAQQTAEKAKGAD